MILFLLRSCLQFCCDLISYKNWYKVPFYTTLLPCSIENLSQRQFPILGHVVAFVWLRVIQNIVILFMLFVNLRENCG